MALLTGRRYVPRTGIDENGAKGRSGEGQQKVYQVRGRLCRPFRHFLEGVILRCSDMQLQRVLHNPLLRPPKERDCGFAFATESVPDFHKRPHKFSTQVLPNQRSNRGPNIGAGKQDRLQNRDNIPPVSKEEFIPDVADKFNQSVERLLIPIGRLLRSRSQPTMLH